MEFKVAKLDRTATIVSIVTTAFLIVLSIFIAYTSLATFWFNKYNKQLIPIYYGIIIFVVLMIVLLFIYYRKIVKK